MMGDLSAVNAFNNIVRPALKEMLTVKKKENRDDPEYRVSLGNNIPGPYRTDRLHTIQEAISIRVTYSRKLASEVSVFLLRPNILRCKTTDEADESYDFDPITVTKEQVIKIVSEKLSD